jgi:NAD(P)H-dependent flavin oxidoreductase YrpB (nitropropane dioxygenase family)
MLRTRFTDLVDISIPIQQAGMGQAATPQLAAAVSNAGAFGMISAAQPGGSEPTAIAELLQRTRALTSRPFGVNFVVRADDPAPPHPDCFEIAASGARAVELFLWTDPDPTLFSLIHAAGALVICQVGSAEQAIRAVDAGCDVIVAQSIEAGGHVLGTVGLLPLLDQVLDAVNVPVLAAGGISTPRGMAAALAAGAAGVRIGTRFVSAEEAGAHPTYVQALIGATARDTVYTETFSAYWPNAPHRVLRSCVEQAIAYDGEIVGERTTLTGVRMPVRRFGAGVPMHDTSGAIAAMALWAGESVGGVQRVQPAAEIVLELAQGAEQLLSSVGGTNDASSVR